jgi:hypothetical protein
MGLFSALDEFFSGPPGIAGGLAGDVVDAISENPGKIVVVVAAP